MRESELRNLLDDLSVEEKVGQLFQLSGSFLVDNAVITGSWDNQELSEQELAVTGSVLSISGAGEIKRIQEECMSRQPHHIPALFMLDIINGYHTIFPISLAQGATFEPELAQRGAEIAAKEGAAAGLHVTFSPMADLVRDARWGRVMESTGEDPYLNSCFSAAMVRGYQGNDVREKGRLAACVKHFAGYGAPEGGRDYDNVELSERTLREAYLPAYEAAIKAGAKLVMTSFNSLNGIPASANKKLMRNVLRQEMNFDGVLISDYDAVGELLNHGIAEDGKAAAKLAIEAGVDIEMVSQHYLRHMSELMERGEVPVELLDQAVWRVLKLKNSLGLFENPYKDADEEAEKQIVLCREHREMARETARKSFVLLENKEEILPLRAETGKKIAFIGPYADSQEICGSWSFPPKDSGVVSIKKGMMEKNPAAAMCFHEGCYILRQDWCLKNGEQLVFNEDKAKHLMAEAVNAARGADTVVLCLGEHYQQSGEGASRTVLQIPEEQKKLLREVTKVNSNIVTLVFTGRPLELEEEANLSKAVMIVWFPGTESGGAIADVLLGEKEPGGRLPMSFPYRAAQMPLYYNRFRTGRPSEDGAIGSFRTGYVDQVDKALYPFGSGIGYTRFQYGSIWITRQVLTGGQPILAFCMVTNVGKRAGTETVQLYLADLHASVIRPVRQLRGFQKITLAPGESCEVVFEIREEMLRFWDSEMNYVSEPGQCMVFIGHDSTAENSAQFVLE